MMKTSMSKLYQQVLNFLVTFAAVVAVIYTVTKEKWVKYDCNERVQLGLLYVQETLVKLKKFYLGEDTKVTT